MFWDRNCLKKTLVLFENSRPHIVVRRLRKWLMCENLCLKVLLIILVICRYFGNIPWYHIYVKKFHPTNYDMTKSIFSTLKWNEYERQLINRITTSGSECVKYLHENKGFFLKTFKSKDFCMKLLKIQLIVVLAVFINYLFLFVPCVCSILSNKGTQLCTLYTVFS